MWSHISVILVLWSQVRVNHCICNVVNTVFYWSVYLRVYSNALPPCGPRLPLPHSAIAYIMQRHGAWWGQTSWQHPPCHTKYVGYQWLTCLWQLLCNQLPLLVVSWKVKMSQQGCVEVPMLILPYPQGGWWQIKCPTLDGFKPRAYTWVLHTDFRIPTVFLQWRMKRQAQRITHEELDKQLSIWSNVYTINI